MKVGILTAPVSREPLDKLIPWAASIGVQQIELDVGPGSNFDALTVTDSDIASLNNLLAKHNITLSSIVCYWHTMMTGVTPEHLAMSKKVFPAAIQLAPKLGVELVGAIAGFPTPGKTGSRPFAKTCPST
jgi:sugar phosphate isomerase/epimerase